MDIAALSMSLSQMNVSSSVSTAMLAKSMDVAEATGEKMVEMLEECVDPMRGQTIDIMI